jgi:hypothetical protein
MRLRTDHEAEETVRQAAEYRACYGVPLTLREPAKGEAIPPCWRAAGAGGLPAGGGRRRGPTARRAAVPGRPLPGRAGACGNATAGGALAAQRLRQILEDDRHQPCARLAQSPRDRGVGQRDDDDRAADLAAHPLADAAARRPVLGQQTEAVGVSHGWPVQNSSGKDASGGSY